MTRDRRNLLLAVATAALLWFYMFSPWTQGRPNFWIVMSCSAVILTSLGLAFTPDRQELSRIERPMLQILGGIALAFFLWGIFWIGDKASSWIFDFARTEVDAVYSMKHGLPTWTIGLLLLFLIGPAEELFWRGYVQRTLSRTLGGRHPEDFAFLLTAVVYALVHIWSFNFMLVMAALVAGLVWGFIYRLCPKALPALIISHALWDVLVFVILPI
ncbi:MAG: CPBP family intramembrane metalloprotease [Bacteroidales bacterium]|jgi:CAAX amino terminal protease family.|nr:CPBP family intramembrane metalloprotease [Bacteroidales bacterium]